MNFQANAVPYCPHLSAVFRDFIFYSSRDLKEVDPPPRRLSAEQPDSNRVKQVPPKQASSPPSLPPPPTAGLTELCSVEKGLNFGVVGTERSLAWNGSRLRSARNTAGGAA